MRSRACERSGPNMSERQRNGERAEFPAQNPLEALNGLLSYAYMSHNVLLPNRISFPVSKFQYLNLY